MKKVVLKLDLHDHKEKRKAMKVVSGLSGIDSIAMDMKDKKLTVTGDFDPVMVVRKLRKQWHTDILTVGPAKEEKKDGEKKDGGGGAKKDDNKKKDEADPFKAPNGYFYYPYYNVTPYYHVVEAHPNSCVIC